MATASNLQILINAKNNASKSIKDVKSDLAGLNKTASTISGGLAGIGALVGVGAFVEVTNQIGAMVDQAVRVELLRESFENLARTAGQSADSMLDALRSASFGMIADADLMLSANKAMMLGVADTTDEMVALLDVARVRGQAMGLSVTDAFNDIVTGLGRESALILDNLGITIDLDRTYKEYANSLGKTVSALSQVERKQALVNEVMRQSADMPSTAPSGAAAALAQAQVAQQQAAQEVGTFFAPSWRDNAQAQIDLLNQLQGEYSEYAVSVREVSDIVTDQQFGLLTPIDGAQLGRFTALRDAMSLLTNEFEVSTVGLVGYQIQLDAIAESAIRNQKVSDQQAAAINRAVDGINAAKEAYAAEQAELDRLDPKLDNLRVSTDAASTAMRNNYTAAGVMVRGLSQIQAQAGATSGVIYDLRNEIMDLNAVSARAPSWYDALSGIEGIGVNLVDNLGIDAAIAKENELYTELRKSGEVLAALGYDSQYISTWIESQVQGTRRWASELDKVATQSVPAISQEFSNLKSTVESVLSGALDTGVGFSAEDILPREDAINENARRLADIAKNGLTGQDWMSEFAQEAPQEFAAIMRAVAEGGDAKQAAALILRDFEDGLRTSLIDKEAAKERVKRMIMGEQSMAALATEIAQELATEMGIPLQEAMAAAGAALGVPATGTGEGAAGAGGIANAAPPDMTSQGAAAGTSFVTGFQTTVTGTLLVATMVQQMEGAITSFNTPGQNAGKTWGSGFMSTVETSIAQPLINLLVALVTPGVMAQLGTQTSQTTPP